MIYAAPGATFTAAVDNFPSGHVGSVYVQVIDANGDVVIGRTPAGIIESPAASGHYIATIVAPVLVGAYTVFWDDGTTAPFAAADEDLTVVVGGGVYSPLATNADLATRLGITMTANEQARADLLLAQASDLVRSHAKQMISLVTGDVLVTRGVWGNRLLLPERPVVQVSAVTATFMNGTTTAVDPITYFVDRDELVRYDWPLSFTIGNGWLGPGWKLTITYDHGFDQSASPVPYKLAVAKGIALDSAIRAWVNPSNLAQSEIGGILESYPPGSGMLLTAEEKYNLDDLFRRENATLSLR